MMMGWASRRKWRKACANRLHYFVTTEGHCLVLWLYLTFESWSLETTQQLYGRAETRSVTSVLCRIAATELYEQQYDADCWLRSAVPWLRRSVAGLSPQRPGFDPRPFHVEFVVNKVAAVPALHFSPVTIIPPVLHTHSFTIDAA